MTVLPYTLKSYVALAEMLGRRAKDPTLSDVDVAKAVRALRSRREQLRLDLSGSASEVDREKIKENFRADRKKLRKARDEAVEKALSRARDQLNAELESNVFSWGLATGEIIAGKQTYQVEPGLYLQITAKQVEAVIRSTASAPMVGRNAIVRALQQSLERKFKHGIIKIDLKSYFESIPHEMLRRAVADKTRIDTVTRELINYLLAEFASLSHSDHGIPRGVGISSALADLYLSEFDRHMRTYPGVAFYARYVDDIIIVAQTVEQMDAISSGATELLCNLRLEQNADKSLKIETNDRGQYAGAVTEIEYLGYTFSKPVGRKTLETRLTSRRIDRYKKKMEYAFNGWMAVNPVAEQPNTGIDGLLVKRIRFLSTNTRLHNSKSGVSIGVYFSNSALPLGAPQLQELDCELLRLIEKYRTFMSEHLEERLRTQSFVKGFGDRTFFTYTPVELKQISRCWEYVE